MQKLPTTLAEYAFRYWPLQNNVASGEYYENRDITVVTAFFDLGRGYWKLPGGKASPFQRSLDQYFSYFAILARLKNPMVIFVAPVHAERVLDLRRAAGLENITTVYTIASLFEIDQIQSLISEVQGKMTRAFQDWVRFPKAPECTQPAYVVLDALKSIFVNTAIAVGAVPCEQVAWLDFGYARDDNCFDANRSWRFDAGGKINMFHMRPLDDMPAFKIVQRGYVYFQGGCKIGPVSAWPAFSTAIDRALAGLLTSDLVDDEQTLLLMAWREDPNAYRVHPMDRRDWRVAIRMFNEERQGEDVRFRDYQQVNKLKASGMGNLIRKFASRAGRVIDKIS